jgi:membrane-associated protein
MDFLHAILDFLQTLVDLFLHLDKHLARIIADYGVWTYLILFTVVFFETGVVVTPFLPGDSLLFAAGAFAALGALDLGWVLVLLTVAAILGDTVNYWIGHRLAPTLEAGGRVPLVKPAHLERTHQFYERYGGKTIVIARFVPIVRTLAPFVAGVSRMSYFKFMRYNVVGGIAWVLICTLGGYWFGNLPVVRENFSLVMLAIIAISLLPGVVEFWRHRRAGRQRRQPTE